MGFPGWKRLFHSPAVSVVPVVVDEAAVDDDLALGIGQRADGAVLMLVTDGRCKNNHLGASASDLIDIMKKYGAVNAANLDGGSSSCMYYNGEYLMTSVTFYYTNASWNLPLAFVVK